MQMAALHIRFIAKFIDLIVCFSIYTLISTLFGRETALPEIAFFSLFLLSDSINGQSIGKRLLNIRVIEFKTQNSIGFIRSIVRNSLALLNFLLIPAVIDYILYVSYFRRLGDFIAGTCVVKTT